MAKRNRQVTKRSSGTPYYRAVGDTIERISGSGTYVPYAVIDPTLDAPGSPEEIAGAVAETMDLADLNRDKGRYTAEARLFHMATGAPGFRQLT